MTSFRKRLRRARELTYRATNAALIRALNALHRRFDIATTYKIGPHGAAAEFEGSWFSYSPREFGCTGNIDFVPDAENETRDALFARLKGHEVFYDIGAHGGVYSITLKKRLPGLTVHSFEPQPDDLKRNLQLNGIATDNVHAVAVGDKPGSVRMTSKKRSSNYVSENGDRLVPMVRLDEYVRDKKLPAPNWVKIDIEGLELPALQGAKRILRESTPTIICEINHLHARFGTSVADFLGFMRSLSYEIYSLESGQLMRLPNANTFADLGYSADWNFWFVHGDRDVS